MSVTKKYFSLPISFLFLLTFSIAGCSGGGGGSNGPLATTLSVSFGLKQLLFSWPASDGATHYKLLENPDGASGFSQVGANISGTSVTIDIPVHLKDWANAQYILQACNSGGCTDSNQVSITSGMLSTIGYFKSGNTTQDYQFGFSISLSDDGSTLAVGEYLEGNDAGVIYIYKYDGSTWTQQDTFSGNNTEDFDYFGYAVSLSGDGNTLAVGAIWEDSNALGINGNQADNSEENSGAVYVFNFDGANWNQQAYIKASNTGTGDLFGSKLSLSSDGNTLAVGTEKEDSDAIGMACNEAAFVDNNTNTVNDCQDELNPSDAASASGAVYVFRRVSSNWTQQAYIKASNAEANDEFGSAVSLSSDGNTLAVGAKGEDSGTGTQGDNSALSAGAAYVFSFDGSNWNQQTYIKASNVEDTDSFGTSVSLSNDGNTLLVGAPFEDSNTLGMACNDEDPIIDDTPNNGIQDCQEADIGADVSGAAYVFSFDGSNWNQQAYVKASNTGGSDQFGTIVSISGDGNTLAVGAIGEASSAIGINGDENDNSLFGSGAVYVFSFDGSNWSQQSYVKANNTYLNDSFGSALSLSSDGNTLAVGAHLEDGNTTGIGGNQDNDDALDAGAVYLY